MVLEISSAFWPLLAFFALLLIAGLWCMLATRNLLRMLIGLEIMTKSVTLLIILAGHLSGRMALAQAMVVTVIVIEVVVVVAAAGLILGFFQQTDGLDVKHTRRMRG